MENKLYRFKIELARIVIDTLVHSQLTKHKCLRYWRDDDRQSDISISISEDDFVSEKMRQAKNVVSDEILQADDVASDKMQQADEECFIKCGNEEYYIKHNFEREYHKFEFLALYRKIVESILDFDVLLIHGSAIAIDDSAFLFIAPSGTGKSTHTRLWREHFGERALMVNDDKPLIRIEDNQVLVCGTPWNGKHNLDTNVQVPLKGICYLERSEDNSIEQMPVELAFRYMMKQTYRPDDQEKMLKTLDLLDRLMEMVPIYKLQVNNFKDDAVQVACAGLGVEY